MIMAADVFVAGMADQDRSRHQFERPPARPAAETALAHIGDRMAVELLDERPVVRPGRAPEVGHGNRVRAAGEASLVMRPILALRARRGNRKQHVEQRLAAGAAGALDRQQPALGDAAAMRGHPVGIAAGLENAMAGHDDHERVSGQRLRHRMHGAGGAELGGDLAIGPGFAARDGLRQLVDPLIEGGMPVISSATSERSAALPRSSAAMPSIATLDFGGGRSFAGLGKELKQPAPGFDLARLGQLHAQDAAIAPCDAASADHRIENGVPTP